MPKSISRRIPGDIALKALSGPNSAYASSTEDHFSDAPEGHDDCEDTTNTPLSASILDISNTEKVTVEKSFPDKIQLLNHTLNSHPIPGSFESDVEDDDEKSTPIREENQSEDTVVLIDDPYHSERKSIEAPVAAKDLKISLEEKADLVEDANPEVVVRWNEHEDKIQRKVRAEKEKIERLVQKESRSISPSANPSSIKRSVLSGAETPINMEESSEVPSSEDQYDTIELPAPVLPIETSEEFPDDKMENGDGSFGDDDFDDFGDAVEGEDFDDFKGFEEVKVNEVPNTAPQPMEQITIPLPVPIMDFKDTGNLQNALSEALEKMFPQEGTKRKVSSIEPRSFVTERSLSLWNQLVAPPPLLPPNWKVSRIRRLFLVSLGVPVDLDEILPAETKQKKLVLPSTNIPRKSMDSRPSSARNSMSGSRSASRKRGDDKLQSKSETLDMSSARILCSTSDVALANMTVDELKTHIGKLNDITKTASDALTYWLGKRDGAVGDKETFETVIESLVGYARKKRQNG